MAAIDVTMDTAGVERGSFILSDQLDKVANRIKELTSVQNTFNAAGVQTGATIKGLTVDGKEFTATLGLMSKAERDLAAAGIDVATSLKNIKYKDQKKDTDDLAKSTNTLREFADKLGTSFRYFATYKAFNFIADGLKEGVKEANKLQIEISKIRTISQGEGQQSFKKFGEDIQGVSNKTGVDVNEVAKAFYDTTSNQAAKGKDVASFVQTAAQLARVTGSSTTDTVNLLSSRINAFGLNAKEADKIAAEFFRTIDEGRVVASELANTIGRTDVLASNLGIAFQDVDATLAITTQKGFKTADAMTLLTNLMIKLEKPTESTAAFFKSIGAESGEAAIKISGGLIPLLRKIVEQTKSGVLPVSAFFDEIRGRKQFAVFEQSIDEIETFSNKLKDVKSTLNTYEKAVEIRGESPADKLNIEFNKLKNVFKVDIGQEILKLTADFISWAGGADQVTKNAATLTEILKIGAITIASYSALTLGIAAYNYIAATSFTALGVAARSALAVMAPFLIAYASFKATRLALKQFDVGNTKEFTFLDIDPKGIRAVGDEIGRLKEAYEDFKKASNQKIDPFAGFEASAKKIGEAYKELQGIIARAITVNDGALDSAKAKSKETADAMKVSFGVWQDTIRSRISEFKKAITDANNEIDKSKKNVLSFKETLDEILFQSKLKYANDDESFGNQKQKLTEEKIGSLRTRGRELFAVGDEESVAEARKLYTEAAKLQAQLKDLKVEREKTLLEKFGGPGEKTLYVDVNDLIAQQIELKKELEAQEDKLQKKQTQKAEGYKKTEKIEEERLKRLIQDFDRYNKIDIFNKDGGIASEFKDKTGKFDRSKLDAALNKEESAIRKDGPTDFTERLRIEQGFQERRKALYKEANLAETSDTLKTEQQKNLGKEEEFKKGLEKIKSERQRIIGQQDQDFETLNQFPTVLAGFVNKLATSGQLKEKSPETAALLKALTEAREATTKAEKNKVDIGGVLAYNPVLLEEAKRKNKEAVDKILEIRDKLGDPSTFEKGKIFGTPQRRDVDLTLQDDQGNNITPGGAKSAFDSSVEKLNKRTNELKKNTTEEDELKKKFEKEVQEPLDRIKKLLPELTNSSKDFTESLKNGIKDQDQGLDNLIKKLERVNDLLKNGGGKVGANITEGNNAFAFADTPSEVYAATGGIAGLFPGQPRGLDVYPIWAAKGEMIINARSAAMYKPMLEAIQSRRQPQYMAAGGRVGGDTNVGDITVNVNGGNTDAQTGRNIGKGLERGIRRGTIRLNPKRNS